MPQTTDIHVGTRIRELRAIRDFSLAELGRRAHVSASLLSMVENGERPASPAVVGAVAGALGVTVSVLHGQPYIHMLRKDQLDAMLSPISSALGSWDIPPDDVRPPTLDDLADRVAEASRARARGDFGVVAEALPQLITDTASAALEAPAGAVRERAYYLQAEVARTTAIVAYRLGFMGLARLALSQMAAAAPHSGDPRQVAVERYERAQMTHAEGSRPDRGLALVRRALRDLPADGTPETHAVRGSLLLRAAALAAAQRDHTAARDWLGEAEDLASAAADAESGGARYALAFGELNVSLGRMDIAMYQDDHESAVRAAAEVRLPEDYQPTRVAGYLIRKAAAQAWTARPEDALVSLLHARTAAPQLTRYHPEVHETVGALLRARRRASDPVREYAQWSGV